MVQTLLLNTYYMSAKLVRGFVLFDNEKVADHGEEPEPEYELSELVIDFENRAVALHGFSVAVDPSKYPVRGLGDQAVDYTALSREEVKQVIQAALYELYENGVTLPIVYGEQVHLASEVARENSLPICVICERGTVTKHPNALYIELDSGGKLYFGERAIGEFSKALCTPEEVVRSECFAVDVTLAISYNISLIALKMHSSLGGVTQVLNMLTKPYRVLGLDSGVIDKGSRPDIVVYDLRDSRKYVNPAIAGAVVLRGYTPDYVFVSGDVFFERGEALVVQPVRIDNILLREAG